jgi:hypothetical protein
MEVNGEFESPLQRLAYVNNEAADNLSEYITKHKYVYTEVQYVPI